METILEIATNSASDPLAISGFFAGAFLLIIRQILKKDIFPTLTKKFQALFSHK